ncbi:MAG: hypothetical protein ABIH37_00600 [archaeon]
MRLFKNIFHKETKKTDHLISGALRQLKKIENKKFSEKSIQELSLIFRIYLREKYKLKQSLTYEEVIIEIRTRKMKKHIEKQLINLSTKINKLKYKLEEFDKDIFKILISEFKELITGKEIKKTIPLKNKILNKPSNKKINKKEQKQNINKVLKKEKQIDKKISRNYTNEKKTKQKQQQKRALKKEKEIDKKISRNFNNKQKQQLKKALKREKQIDKKISKKFTKKQKKSKK